MAIALHREDFEIHSLAKELRLPRDFLGGCPSPVTPRLRDLLAVSFLHQCPQCIGDRLANALGTGLGSVVWQFGYHISEPNVERRGGLQTLPGRELLARSCGRNRPYALEFERVQRSTGRHRSSNVKIKHDLPKIGLSI